MLIRHICGAGAPPNTALTCVVFRRLCTYLSVLVSFSCVSQSKGNKNYFIIK